MDINSISNQQFTNLFGPNLDDDGSEMQGGTSFGMTNDDNLNLFPNTPAVVVTPAEAGKEETPTEQPKTGEEDKNKEEDKKEDIDILGIGDDKKDKPKTDEPAPIGEIVDMSSYFEDRLKKGTFVAIEEEGEDGQKKLFIPKTPEEVDEVLQMQVDFKIEEAKKELNEKWLSDKTPAFQFLARYSDLIDDPRELIPVLQGVQNIQSIAEINEKEIEGAEELLRYNLQAKGLDKDLIDTQIESLKTTDKLISTAEKMKPQMLQEESKRLQQMERDEKKKLDDYRNMVIDLRENAIKAIDAPFYGTATLANEDKALVYDLIAEPSPESKGYQIYDEIDKLFESKNFTKLKQVALLLAKEESFFTHIGAKVANDTSTGLQKKLRVVTDSRTTTSANPEEPSKIMQRNQYKANKGTVHFGRS